MGNISAQYIAVPNDKFIIRLTWFSIVGAVKYDVYRNDVKITPTPTIALTYDDTGEAYVKYLYYYVEGLDSNNVVVGQSDTIVNIEARTEDMMNRLRRILKDPNKRRWQDEELITYLDQGAWMLNAMPPYTSYGLEQVPFAWEGLVLMGAQACAYLAQAGFEVAKEFSYSDMGLSITIERSMKYNTLGGAIMNTFATQGASLKKSWLHVATGPAALIREPMPFKIRTYSPYQWRIR
jgi:hypothetical protein